MYPFSTQPDREQQWLISGLWREYLGPYTADTLYTVSSRGAGSSRPYASDTSWSSHQCHSQTDTPDGTCGTPQWSSSFATGTLNQPLNPHSGDIESCEQPTEGRYGIQEITSSEPYTQALNGVNWAEPTVGFGADGQDLDWPLLTFVQPDLSHGEPCDLSIMRHPYAPRSHESIGLIDNDSLSLSDSRIPPRYIPPIPNPEPWNVYTSQGLVLSPTEFQSTNPEYLPFTNYTCFSSNRPDESQTNNVTFPYRSSQAEQLEKPPGSNPAGKPPRFGPSKGPPQEGFSLKKNKGGRRGPLSPEGKKKARQMRKIGACWRCKLLRIPCTRDERCKPKLEKENPFPYYQPPLKDLTAVFLPNILFGPLEAEALRTFTEKNASLPLKNTMMVDLDSGFGLPYRVKVHEVVPIGNELLVSKQFRLNQSSRKYEVIEAWSPPLGIDLEKFKSKDLDMYLDNILRNRWKAVLKSLFYHRNEWDIIQRKVLRSLRRYHHSLTNKNSNSSPPSKSYSLPSLCLKLIVIHLMMSRAFAISEETTQSIWQKLSSPGTVLKPYGTFSSPRLVNKQLKFVLSTVFQGVFTEILRKISALLLKSRKELWPQAFAAVLALSIVVESLQMMILCKERLNQLDLSPSSSSKAGADIRSIDDQFHFLVQLLQTKYKSWGISCWRPLSDGVSRSDLVEAADREFVDALAMVVEEHGQYFRKVSHEPPPEMDGNEVGGTCGRIVAQFLLSLS